MVFRYRWVTMTPLLSFVVSIYHYHHFVTTNTIFNLLLAVLLSTSSRMQPDSNVETFVCEVVPKYVKTTQF